MKAVVVYESVFGNTHEIAEAVAEGLRERADVEVAAVGDVTPGVVEQAELLVVGGPTHVHGMASHRSIKGAAETARKKGTAGLEVDPEGPILRDWFDELPGGQRIAAAAFDTRLGAPRVFTGSAAKGIGRRLERHGFHLVAEPESFVVDGTPGRPVDGGELERAREWGKSLGAAATTSF